MVSKGEDNEKGEKTTAIDPISKKKKICKCSTLFFLMCKKQLRTCSSSSFPVIQDIVDIKIWWKKRLGFFSL